MSSLIRMGALVAALTAGAALANGEGKVNGTGGSGDEGTGGAGQMEQPVVPEPGEAEHHEVMPPAAESPVMTEPAAPYAETLPPPSQARKPRVPLGPYVMIDGGADFYTGDLASRVNPGPTYGALIGLRPLSFMAVELGYSGAVNELDRDLAPINVNGADIVRNGGQANVVLNLPVRFLQPYVMGGYGLERYNVRGGQAFGYRDDTNSYIPAGIGLHTTVGAFTADLRGTYNFLIDQDFAPIADTNAWDGRIGTTLNIGGQF
jgi:hypothetical protein